MAHKWQYSSFTPDGENCIGITVDSENPDRIGIQESDDPAETIVWTSRVNFRKFIDGVKAGEFDAYAE